MLELEAGMAGQKELTDLEQVKVSRHTDSEIHAACSKHLTAALYCSVI